MLTASISGTLRRGALALLVAGIAASAGAQERPGRANAGQSEPKGLLRLLPPDAVSAHEAAIAGGKLAYTATAGTFSLYDQSGERSAAVFYTAYVAKDAAPNRPLTFVFNGGPGAASAFLHLGLVGPKILDFGPARDGATAQLRDNPETWLTFTDLVMIDPIATGWSRPAKSDGGKDFWGVRRDADVMAKTIALYVANNSRAGSPKYLLGESYGGFRAAKVARALQRDQGIIAAGILMLSPMLDGELTFGGDRFALGAALQLPSLAATELERRGAFSMEALAEAERFALTDYLTTLAGPAPQGEAARNFYARVARITGLPEDVVAGARGFVRDAYLKQLKSGDRKLVSRYDATFAVDDPFPDQDAARGADPVLDGLVRAYGGAFAAYARDALGYKTEMTYVLLASEVSGNWDWGRGGRPQASVDDDLRTLLALNPSFRLLVAHGYSDLVTPYAMSRYVLDHLPPIGTAGRVQLKLYRGGHMLYLDPESQRGFSADAKAFYRAADTPTR